MLVNSPNIIARYLMKHYMPISVWLSAWLPYAPEQLGIRAVTYRINQYFGQISSTVLNVQPHVLLSLSFTPRSLCASTLVQQPPKVYFVNSKNLFIYNETSLSGHLSNKATSLQWPHLKSPNMFSIMRVQLYNCITRKKYTNKYTKNLEFSILVGTAIKRTETSS